MWVGKRHHRPPIKRTTSLSEITIDQFIPPPLTSPLSDDPTRHHRTSPASTPVSPSTGAVSPFVRRTHRHRRASADFLTTCSLCRHHLVAGADIYMYRGDNAYCSLECRQHQMRQDERKEKKVNKSSYSSILADSSPTTAPEDVVISISTAGGRGESTAVAAAI